MSAATATTAMQSRRDDPTTLMKQWISKSSRAFEKLLPKYVTPERFVKIAHVAITKDPKLALCDPRSVIIALMHAAELGLEPNSPQGHCYLIPYKNKDTGNYECQFQQGYKGLLHLAYLSNRVAAIDVHVAHDHDDFGVIQGDEPKIHHVINVRGARGEVIGAYMIATLTSGKKVREYMSHADVEKVRQKSPSANSPAWRDHWSEMARKTVLKRGLKRVPQATEKDIAARAIEIDNAIETEGSAARLVDHDVLSELPFELQQTEVTAPTQGDRLASKIASQAAQLPVGAPAVVIEHAAQPEPAKTQSTKRGAKSTTAAVAPPAAKPPAAPLPKPEPEPLAVTNPPWMALEVGAEWVDGDGVACEVVSSPFGKALRRVVADADAPPPEETPSALRDALLAEIAALTPVTAMDWQVSIADRWDQLPEAERPAVVGAFEARVASFQK